jgi:hypothetical protein
MSRPDISLSRKITEILLLTALIVGVGTFCPTVSAQNESIVSTGYLSSSFGFSSASCPSRERQTAPVVPFCDLVHHPDLYDQRVIRTKAIMIAGYEQSFLYSPLCNGRDTFVWADRDSSYKPNHAVEKVLDSLLAHRESTHSGRAEVDVVGRFNAPQGKRYGHLDQFRMRFLVMRFDNAKAAPQKEARPRTKASIAERVEAEEIVLYTNDEFVLHFAGAPAYSSIPSEYLSDKFRFTGADGHVENKAQFLGTAVSICSGHISNTDVKVHVSGHKAVTTGLLTRSCGSIVEKFQYVSEFVNHGKRWQIASSRMTVSTAPP